MERVAAQTEIELDTEESAALLPIIASLVETANICEELPGAAAPAILGGRRTVERFATAEDDPFNVFITRCHVEGEPGGPLAGKTVGVKDNISVAGVPTTNGSRLTPFVPDLDATVVERILRAGGTIVGKLNMDDFGASGTGESSAFGPPRNPLDPSRSAGGSSGGSGAAVAAGAVDLALGVDQGGSGRIPAAFCGVAAIKPTHGSVSSFGVTHIDHTIDHVTSFARSVVDAWALHTVVAGEDWRDPQWARHSPPHLTSVVGPDGPSLRDVRVGVVLESMNPDICSETVLAGVESTSDALAAGGAAVERCSIPLWAFGLRIFQPYVAHLVWNMFMTDGEGVGHLGFIDARRTHDFAISWRTESRDLAPQVKAWLISAAYLKQRYSNVPYARLHNQRLLLRDVISSAFKDYDVLLTPTLPITAPTLVSGPTSASELAERTSTRLCFNTAPVNLSGHPAVTVPTVFGPDGMPAAAQFLAGHGADALAAQVAYRYEQSQEKSMDIIS